ncbi:hypothetical protein CVT24_004909 [Panaeolus cyanescens]|uniref:Fungal lipase-type domain-containing protein n=1 Tax=Panaeolus cyanescens TaxID=181874 RepID=A0A409YAZ5_9AGAR|nr:hypothetical protein CVT24_004909 [Panaeolus cyanescens]
MLSKSVLSALLAAFLAHGAAASPVEGKTVLQQTVNSGKDIPSHASSTLSFAECPRPNGQIPISEISDTNTDTQGIVVRDDTKKEIVVAFRGTTSDADIKIDMDIVLVPFVSPGVDAPANVSVHRGFLNSWNSVAPSVLDTIRKQLDGREEYSVITSGHSLGGALASGQKKKAVHDRAAPCKLCRAKSLICTDVRMYTYGQPRTGNSYYASWVNEVFQGNGTTGKVYRVTHTTDPVPHLPPQSFGYTHHGIEYWISQNPAISSNMVSCDPSGEDMACSNSVPLTTASFSNFTVHNWYYSCLPAMLLQTIQYSATTVTNVIENKSAVQPVGSDSTVSPDASTSYTPFVACATPNGQIRVAKIWHALSDTQGYIARDDKKKEIVVVFRGSTSPMDFIITDANIPLVPFVSLGVSPPDGVRVHNGFLTGYVVILAQSLPHAKGSVSYSFNTSRGMRLRSWNSVAPFVLETIRQQLVGLEGYGIAVVGHSLGGALASVSAMVIKANFPDVTGNPLYAKWVNSVFGVGKAFRVTHTTDPIPHVPEQFMGYTHHGAEYWISKDPANTFSIIACGPEGEDMKGANSVPLPVAMALPSAHLYYMNILSVTMFNA